MGIMHKDIFFGNNNLFFPSKEAKPNQLIEQTIRKVEREREIFIFQYTRTMRTDRI
jgi:hypothetical protein